MEKIVTMLVAGVYSNPGTETVIVVGFVIIVIVGLVRWRANHPK
jgi:hypothetical protein